MNGDIAISVGDCHNFVKHAFWQTGVKMRYDPAISTTFLHIPKTAGSSVITALCRGAEDNNVPFLKFLFASDLVSVYARSDVRNVRLFCGHISVREARWLIGKTNMVAFFREPIERVISNYFWWRQCHLGEDIDVDGSRHKIIDETLTWEEDLQRIFTSRTAIWKFNEISNIQVHQMAGHLYRRDDLDDASVLSKAIRNLSKLFFVGDFASLHTDVIRLSSVLFGRCIEALPHEKRGAVQIRPGDFSPKVLRMIEDANALDLRFYEKVARWRQRHS